MGYHPHPAYSPDLAPTDYHLFRSLSNHLREKKFDDESSLKMDLADFFSQKSKDFYERGSFLCQSVGDRLWIATEHISLKTSLMLKRKRIK